MADSSFLFLLSSGRPAGNSEGLARKAAESLLPETRQEWRDLGAAQLPPFEDMRYSGSYGPLTPSIAELAEATLTASNIVFVAPLYWYGLPAVAKLFLDHWSHWLRVPGMDFRARIADKSLWLVMAHSGSTEEQIAPAVDTLRWTADYLKMNWGGALIGYANAPGAVDFH